jgi:parallel beta-helix repeat protein
MKKLIFAIASLFLTITCQAKIINVDDDGPADFNSIQLAINFATDGDTVIVAPVAYTGPGNRDIDFLGKAITVQSSGPNDPNIVAATIIDCNGTRDEEHRGFTFHNGEDANSVLNGFTITNGHVESGSGILCDKSSPTIADCMISDNASWDRSGGGAISIFQSLSLINNCIITNNKGNGIYCSDSNSTLTNCTFNGNSLRGMFNEDSNPTLTNCTFSGNSGSGMFNWDSNPTLINCTFSGNSSHMGAGMYNRWSNPTLTNCTFSRNSAQMDGGGM